MRRIDEITQGSEWKRQGEEMPPMDKLVSISDDVRIIST
jgi:hypothetical protein